jgi:septum site-determining protein MinC
LEKILIKGDLKEGLKIYVDPSLNWEEIKTALWNEFEKNERFLKGLYINIDLKEIKIDEEDWLNFQQKIFQRFGIILIREFLVTKITDKNIAQIIIGPIRNGQKYISKDNILILGDINPGGEVISEKSIFVLGKIRGSVYAGKENNRKAIIFALSLQPIHLQIANLIWDKEEIFESKSGYWVYIEDNILKISINF